MNLNGRSNDELSVAVDFPTEPEGAGRECTDTPLLYLSPGDPWTTRDSFEGTQVMGATGLRETSGAGATLARAFLANGYGGWS